MPLSRASCFPTEAWDNGARFATNCPLKRESVSSFPIKVEGKQGPIQNSMRTSIYDGVAILGTASIVSNISGSTAVNGTGVDTLGMTDAALHVVAQIPSGTPTGASYVVALQESPDNGVTAFTAALDNTGTAIGFTLTQLVGATGTTASGSNVITSMSSVACLAVGMAITGTGVAATLGAVITAILSTTSIQISRNATASGSVTLSFSTEGIARIEGLGLNRKRFLRAVVTPTFTAGSSPASAVVAEIVQGGPPQQLPVSAPVSNT